MLHVIYAEFVSGYKVYVEFNNGERGTIDFEKILKEDHREIINELLNKKLFKTVKLNLNTLCWDNEVDFAPEFLYEQMKEVEKVAGRKNRRASNVA